MAPRPAPRRAVSPADPAAGPATAELRPADLDHWLPAPSVSVSHRLESSTDPDALWAASRSVGLADAALLGRLVHWRIRGLPDGLTFDEMFRADPFLVLDGDRRWALVSGLVGRIWTFHRDYPRLDDPEEFRRWSAGGTARVVFANWVEPAPGGAALCSETRVQAFGHQGRIGLATLRPVIRAFHHLIASDGMHQAVVRAER